MCVHVYIFTHAPPGTSKLCQKRLRTSTAQIRNTSTSQEVPSWLQDCPKKAPRGSKRPQEGPKRTPTGLKQL